MNLKDLHKEKELLIDIINDTERKLMEEEERFIAYGYRTEAASKWRMYMEQHTMYNKINLANVLRDIREQTPTSKLTAVMVRIATWARL